MLTAVPDLRGFGPAPSTMSPTYRRHERVTPAQLLTNFEPT